MKKINIKNIYYLFGNNNKYISQNKPQELYNISDRTITSYDCIYINNKFIYTKHEKPILYLKQQYKNYLKYLALLEKINRFNQLIDYSSIRELDNFELGEVLYFVNNYNKILAEHNCIDITSKTK